MKLLNRTTLYLSGAFAIVMAVWAVLLYFSMLDEIYDSIDDGLDNQKLLIIDRVHNDPAMLAKSEFNESNYAIKKISDESMVEHDRYNDTMMYMQNENDFEPVRILHTDFMHGDKYYELKVITSMVEEDDLIADLLSHLVFLYVLIIVCVILVNNVVLRRIWKPFYGQLAQLKEFDLKDPKLIKQPATSIMEFNALNETVSAMLKNNVRTFNSQKQFIENASHELQTPLATSIGKIELLLEEENIDENTATILAAVLRNLERLTRLNRSLILISSIENRQFRNEEIVNLNDIVALQVMEFAPLSEYNQVSVNVKEKGVFKHTMNPDLAVILISNLLRNALVYNYRNGKVFVEIGIHDIAFSNTSHDDALDQSRIFQRFYRNTSNRHSTGLGLSIAKGICEISALAISYEYSNDLHVVKLLKTSE